LGGCEGNVELTDAERLARATAILRIFEDFVVAVDALATMRPDDHELRGVLDRLRNDLLGKTDARDCPR
jgi:hypothetical protein